MAGIKTVVQCVVTLLNTRLTFAPFSFTIMQFLLALTALEIIIFAIRKIFTE